VKKHTQARLRVFFNAFSLFDLPSLFAGKMHAVLCREYVKGRDWYDFLWYAARSVRPNLILLAAALDQTGPWAGKTSFVDEAWCHRGMVEKIASMDFVKLREDVRRFLKPVEVASLNLWTREFFWLERENCSLPKNRLMK